jgi:putative endopeptidase
VAKKRKIKALNKMSTPGSDFYNYVNGEWQRRVHIPNTDTSYNASAEVEEKLYEQIMKCVHTCMRKEPNHPLSIFVKSIETQGKQTIADISSYLQLMNTCDTVGRFGYAIGFLNSLHCSSPIGIEIGANCHGHCCIYIKEAKLGLPNKDYYKKPQVYKQYLKKMGALLHLDDFEKHLDIERLFIDSVYDDEDEKEKALTLKSIQRMYPNIPWIQIMEGFGLDSDVYMKCEYRISNDMYIERLNTELPKLTHTEWIRWLQVCILYTFADTLPEPFSDIEFQLYGSYLKGSIQKPSKQHTTIAVLNDYVPQLLGSVCAKDIFEPDTKRKMTELAHHIRQSTQDRIEHASWLHPSTKRKALEKLKSMLFQIAYPKKWLVETEGVPLYKDRLFINMINISKARIHRQIVQLRENLCSRDIKRWDDSVFEVNAFYYSDMNMLAIPAGTLLPPFFNRRSSMATNLGGIGTILGHEISHGFDDHGRLYDSLGDLKNWWFSKDEKTYHRLTRKIQTLFDSMSYKGKKVDGKLTLDENIADICGVGIAINALNTYLNTASKKERIQAYREFFISYATSWRTKDRRKKALYALRVSEHAPARLRVNCVVGQFDEFYEAFDIQSGDPGWIEPASRIRIF